ncbi:DUF3137 domain-containing protein [Campylobacter geochelonis]|uniref:DUF3137 domain-containing protein n=1 Tax=Campylobacter geochelonis TaxID=1780362 RepID=UPI000770ABF2|nr:DUF3137 domain-containing protein [Campylobacter geochelonis]CZE46181.1 putative Galanin [Campylobacter geochelonis]
MQDKQSEKMALLELEKMRKSILSKFGFYRIWAFISAACFVVVAYFFVIFNIITELFNDGSTPVKIVVLIVFVIIFYITYNKFLDEITLKESEEFRNKFKEKYLSEYIKNLGYSYYIYSHVNAVYLIKSGLFPAFSRQKGNDEIKGEKNGVIFSFSDIILEDLEEESSYNENYFKLAKKANFINTFKKGFGENDYIKLYEGLFFMADFNKNITSKTFVMQNREPRIKRGLESIKMDNPLFNTKFRVYSDDIQNAMYILSPALMERINSLSNVIKYPINISFIDTQIFIAIETNRDSFEPDIHQSIITKNPISHIKRQLDAIFAIIDVLSLDANLWAKRDKKVAKEVRES